MSEVDTSQVREATEGFFPPGKVSGFTEDERREIIARLQAVENLCGQMSRVLTGIESALFLVHENEDGTTEVVDRVDGIYGFCQRLGVVLDTLGSNPMFAAMMPPDFAEGEG